MLKDTIAKLYSFIIKLVLMLEEELDEFKSNKFKNNIITRKNITENLHKIINLTILLNKLNKEESVNENAILPEEDKLIIENFLHKYNDKGK